MAPAVGFEPTTNRLTADRSTTELRWIVNAKKSAGYILPTHSQPASANRLIPTTVGTLPLSYAGTIFRRIAGIHFVHRINSGKSFPNRRSDLVAGAGFEPAIRRLPDYEPRRCNPVIE